MRATAACIACARSLRPRATAEAASAHRLPPGQGMGQCAAVDVLQLAPERHAVGDAARADAAPRCQLAEEMRRRLAFDGRVGGEDQLAHLTLGEDGFELAHAELL